MPLLSGSSDDVVSKNIERLVKEGYSKSQAAAIAYHEARKHGAKHKAMEDRDGTEIVSVIERLPPKSIDQSQCITYDVICTGTSDRAGDVLIPRGCDTSEHKAYPVVLWNHGRSHDVLGTLPIGLALDKSGNYGVQVESDAVYSSTKYAQSLPFAMQLFALQAEGVLRGNSVAARPVKSRELPRRTLPDKSQVRCFQYDNWILHEFSKTPGPVNPEALTILVEKGRVNDEPLDPILKSYLEPMKLAGKEWANGWNFSKASSDMADDGTKEPEKKKSKDEPDPTADLKRDDDMNDDDKKKKDEETAKKAALDAAAIEKAKKDKEDDDEKKKKDEQAKETSNLKTLKPSISLMASAMQAARDFRAALAKSAETIEDEMTLVTLSETDGYLEKIEKACAETLIAKGVKDAPNALTGEILKSQIGENKVEQVVLKGYADPPKLFVDVNSPSNVSIVVDPVELAKLNRKLTAMEARASRVAS